MKFLPDQWKTMWLLQDKNQSIGAFRWTCLVLATIPQSFIISIVFRGNMVQLSSLIIAGFRAAKVLRFNEVHKIFETKITETLNQSKARTIRSIQAFYILLLSTHVIGCSWLIVGRVQINQSWFQLAKYKGESAANNLREPTNFEKYIDALFFVVSTMNGMGYGNVIPTTNFEWFVDILIMIAGCSTWGGFFADFTVEVYRQNQIQIENEEKLDQAIQFARHRNLPDEMRDRIKMYYNNVRLKFKEFEQKYILLNQLPLTLKSELSLFFNCELIQNVNFFQLSDPSFVVEISRCMYPQICLYKDFVVEVDTVAYKMFFIQIGFVQILATDNKTVIAYQSQGCYFGEIGVLLTQKRSCSVKAMTTCTFMVVLKTDFENILQKYPQMGKFLRAVGRQRLQTTNPEDLNQDYKRQEDLDQRSFEDREKYLDRDNDQKKPFVQIEVQTVSSDRKSQDISDKKDKYDVENQIKSKDEEIKSGDNYWFIFQRLPIHLTWEKRDIKEFVIIPFSLLFNVWMTIIVTATFYFFFLLPLILAVNPTLIQDQGIWLRIVDVIFTLSFCVDILFRSRLGVSVDLKNQSIIQTDLKAAQQHYIQHLIIYDLIAAIPFYYLLLPFDFNYDVLNFLRILKLFKVIRMNEFLDILRRHSNINKNLLSFALYFILMNLFAHYLACGFIFIGRIEAQKMQRFDGQSLFQDITNRNFLIPPPEITNPTFYYFDKPTWKMSNYEQYINFWYFGSCTMGTVMYGDIIPYAMSEQLYDIVVMILARMFLAFLFGQAASYLTSVHTSKSRHSKKVNNVKKWIDRNQYPTALKQRIDKFHNLIWRTSKGVRKEDIIQDLPRSLRKSVKNFVFKNVVKNWKVILQSQQGKGVLPSIIDCLTLKVIPAGEFIIRHGETAEHMFFIVKGSASVISSKGIHLAKFEEGQNFGEMAIFKDGEVRSASVVADTDTSVAVMSSQDFNKICDLFSTFKMIIKEVVQQRKQQHETTVKMAANQIPIENKLSQSNDIAVPYMSNLRRFSLFQDSQATPGFKQREDEIYQIHQGIIKTSQQKQDEENEIQIKDSARVALVSPEKLSKNDQLPKMSQKSPNQLSQISFTQNSQIKEFKLSLDYFSKLYQQLKDYLTIRRFMICSVLLISTYNLIFIPLQFAFRFPFKGVFLVIEFATILVYLTDLILRLRQIQQLKRKGQNIRDPIENIDMTLMLDDKDEFLLRIRQIKIEAFCSLIAAIPLSLIFTLIDFQRPVFVIDLLCSLRLVKLLPIKKMFDSLMSQHLEKWRIIQVVVYYHLINHYISCLWISLALLEPDIRGTWLRRAPILQPLGMRLENNLDGLSNWTIYLHSSFFVANTLSHVGIGAISAVNIQERIFVAILIPIGIFVYVFLYGNIVSIVSELGMNQQITYFEKYRYVMKKVESLELSKQTQSQINEYFNYIWGDELDVFEDQLLHELPSSIKSDILICKYQEAVENSLIFRDDSGQIDLPLTNSILKKLNPQLYMTGEYIFKAGSIGQNTYIILDGKAALVSPCEDELLLKKQTSIKKLSLQPQVLGVMNPGSHFGNDLPYNMFNYHNRRICHLIALQPCVVGVLSPDRLQSIYKCFPNWEKKVKKINQFMFQKCEKYFESHQEEILEYIISHNRSDFYQLPLKQMCLKYISIHYTFTNYDGYKWIFNRLTKYQSHIDIDGEDMVNKQKIFYYSGEGMAFPLYDDQYLKIYMKNITESKQLNIFQGEGHQTLNKQKSIPQSDQSNSQLSLIWSKMYVQVNSRARRVLDFVQILNLVYIIIFTPLDVGFRIDIINNDSLLISEIISLLLSCLWVFVNFRTQLIVKGSYTLKFSTVFNNYKKNGLWLDILGIFPLNLIIKSPEGSAPVLVVLSILRLIRLPSAWRAIQLMKEFEVAIKNNQSNLLFQIIKACACIYVLGHLVSCLFFFISIQIEENDPSYPLWIDYNNVRNKPIGDQYLRTLYMVYNITCTVGSGDMFPMTNIELVFFILLVTIGDVFFNLAFGLITNVTLMIGMADDSVPFKQKINQIQDQFMSFNLNQPQIRRVEQFLAFEYKHKDNSNLINYVDLEEYLSHGLREEVKFQASRKMLHKMFDEFNSENLMRKISVVLKPLIYLPGDFILNIGEIGNSMFFLAEGQAVALLEDRKSLISIIKQGDFFGELALYEERQIEENVQAQSFCIVNQLKSEDFKEIMIEFPQISELLQEKNCQFKKMQIINKKSGEQLINSQLGNNLKAGFGNNQIIRLSEMSCSSNSTHSIKQDIINETISNSSSNDRSNNSQIINKTLKSYSQFNQQDDQLLNNPKQNLIQSDSPNFKDDSKQTDADIDLNIYDQDHILDHKHINQNVKKALSIFGQKTSKQAFGFKGEEQKVGKFITKNYGDDDELNRPDDIQIQLELVQQSQNSQEEYCSNRYQSPSSQSLDSSHTSSEKSLNNPVQGDTNLNLGQSKIRNLKQLTFQAPNKQTEDNKNPNKLNSLGLNSKYIYQTEKKGFKRHSIQVQKKKVSWKIQVYNSTKSLIQNQNCQNRIFATPKNQQEIGDKNFQKNDSLKNNQSNRNKVKLFSKIEAEGISQVSFNHSIRRPIGSSKRSEKISPKQSNQTQPEEDQDKSKFGRRLSRIILGKNLTLSESARLRIQWTIGH